MLFYYGAQTEEKDQQRVSVGIRLHTVRKYYRQEDIPSAKEEFLESLKYNQKTNDAYYEIQALIGLGTCSIQLNQRDQVLSHLNQALNLAEQHSFSDQKKRNSLILAKYLHETGDPDFKGYALDFFYSYVKTLEGSEGSMTHQVDFKRHSAGDPPGTKKKRINWVYLSHVSIIFPSTTKTGY